MFDEMKRPLRYPTATVPWVRHRGTWPAMWSLAFHGLLLALILWNVARAAPPAPSAGLGVLAGGGGGGGGRQVTLIAVQPLQSAPAPQVATEPVPVPVEVPVVAREIRNITPQVAPVAIKPLARPLPLARVSGTGPGVQGGPGSGTGSGGGVGSGRGTGRGDGVGPGSGGDGGDIFPPVMRFTVLPPTEDRPEEVRGRSYQVVFTVGENGRVLDVEVSPQIADRTYRKKFIDAMRRYRFNPAVRADGTRVIGRAVQTITL